MADLRRALELVRTVADFPEPGVLFRDLNPLFADVGALRTVVDAMAAALPADVDVVAPVEARGFLLGAPLALALGCGMVPVRKAGKLPAVAARVDYQLEYGTASLELPAEVLREGQRVAVVDDVLATGGTVAAVCELVERAGAEVVAVSVVLELTALGGRGQLPGREVQALQAL
ncbi:adenine phosphoribosyltransferase [Actinophytocola xanthii]|uniref:Adenine phosphoribosyltransferase n=1 Tax=Actinophytocola xanthii TaxID=1912961 RepID=A0A1Q8CYZ5_9PSEU|nr:adenine phosphoribosyltransferase [Actinophytocola xanthii]OLF19587.1 adenine phosphoribosyltransferase [Actinophytocola xanthii]